MLQLVKNYLYLETAIALGWVIFYFSLNNSHKKTINHKPFIFITLFTINLFFAPNLLFFHLAIACFPCLLARSRNDLLIIMVVGMLGMPELSVKASLGTLNLFDWTSQMTLALGGALALIMLSGHSLRQRHGVNISLAIFLMLGIFIAARDATATNWLRSIVSVVLAFGLAAFVMGRCATDESGRRTLMAAIAAMGAMASSVLIYETRAHWPLYVSVLERLHVRLPMLIIKLRGGAMRAYGPLDDASSAGFALVITLLAALGSSSIFKPGAFRYSVPLLIAFGLLAPQSRGALIGAAGGILVYALYRHGIASAARVAAGFATIGAVVVARNQWVVASSADAQGTAEYRQRLFARGVQEFYKHPIFGETFTIMTYNLGDMRQGEGIVDLVNSYLYYALLSGAVGLIAFVFVLIWPIFRLVFIKNKIRHESALTNFAAFSISSLFAASVMLIFTSVPPRPIIIVLTTAGAALALKHDRRRTATPYGDSLLAGAQKKLMAEEKV